MPWSCPGGTSTAWALLDFKMPGMDGLELCRRLKISQPSVVVVLITAFSSFATTAAAAEAGVRCSLLKPVDFSVLMPLVAEVVNGRSDNTLVEIGQRRRMKGIWEGGARAETVHNQQALLVLGRSSMERFFGNLICREVGLP